MPRKSAVANSEGVVSDIVPHAEKNCYDFAEGNIASTYRFFSTTGIENTGQNLLYLYQRVHRQFSKLYC